MTNIPHWQESVLLDLLQQISYFIFVSRYSALSNKSKESLEGLEISKKIQEKKIKYKCNFFFFFAFGVIEELKWCRAHR